MMVISSGKLCAIFKAQTSLADFEFLIHVAYVVKLIYLKYDRSMKGW